MTISAHDTILRIALASMAHDPASPLTADERHWVMTRFHNLDPLTTEEREKLREPLLAWSRECWDAATVAILAKQFSDRTMMELSRRDQRTFVEALLHPPTPSTRLRQAAQRYEQVFGQQ